MAKDEVPRRDTAARPIPPTPPQQPPEQFEKGARTGSGQIQADPVDVAPSGTVTEVPQALVGPTPAAEPSTPPKSDGGSSDS